MTARRVGTASSISIALAAGLWATGCPKEEEKKEPEPCTAGTECEGGKACETVAGTADTVCTDPVFVEGQVVSSAGGAAVTAAQVLLLDNTGAPYTAPATTGADGTYSIRVRVERSAAGAPQARAFTLRAAAQGFETFPTAPRRALPIDAADAVLANGKWVVSGDLTHIELDPLAAAGLGSISGSITGVDDVALRGGVLVTLTGAAGASTGLVALTLPDGAFTLHNVPAGTYTVRGYSAGLQLTPAADVVVAASANVENVPLAKAAAPTGTVNGSITPVAGGCTLGTSVVLVPRETMPPGTTFPLTAVSAIRGEVPRGLRAPGPPAPPNITGSYAISGVPDGTYEVLAAWENDPDPCVFDPSGIAGAFYVSETTVPATSGSRDVTLDAFKVTGAVSITGPGAGDGIEQLATTTTTFNWQAYSSSKNYQLAVFDAAGRRVWATTACADAASSCSTTSLTYGTAGGGTTQPATAPALAADSVYQWRVIAIGTRNGATCGFPGMELTQDRECISISEDQRGLFRTP
ncbi:MAG: hypothetical protein HY904_09120 [Deltaproteobacteria bacterium]|nr:hypothetical protein [Deltaproteobacteria bacterium]